MAVLPIRLEGDPVLRKKAAPVPKVTKRIAKLLDDMAETMYDAPGVGLAGPQVGHLLRLIVVDVGDGLHRIVNPVIVSEAGTEIDREGCLSIPGIVGYVERSAHLVVVGLNEKGKPLRIEAEGFFARAIQHEIDHLDGILFTDKALSVAQLVDDEDDDAGEGENGNATSEVEEATDVPSTSDAFDASGGRTVSRQSASGAAEEADEH